MKKESILRGANASADVIDHKNFSQKSHKNNETNNSERKNVRSNQRNNDSQSKSFVHEIGQNQLNSNYQAHSKNEIGVETTNPATMRTAVTNETNQKTSDSTNYSNRNANHNKNAGKPNLIRNVAPRDPQSHQGQRMRPQTSGPTSMRFHPSDKISRPSVGQINAQNESYVNPLRPATSGSLSNNPLNIIAVQYNGNKQSDAAEVISAGK